MLVPAGTAPLCPPARPLSLGLSLAEPPPAPRQLRKGKIECYLSFFFAMRVRDHLKM